MKIKDRVVQINSNKKMIGTIVKIFKGKNKTIKTCAVLWDRDWPDHFGVRNPGRVFFMKPSELEVVDSWSI